jgi:hypothetical protein
MPFDAYCYTTMSFRLKKCWCNLSEAIQHCLAKQIGRNIEAYINDVVVKSKTANDLIADLEETLKHLKEF